MKKLDVKTKKLFDLDQTIAKALFEKYTYPWEVLKELGSFIEELGSTLPDTEFLKIGKNIWVHRSVKLMPTVALAGPLIIGKGASIRSCAFFRGNVIIGEGAVAGNSCEFKNAVLFNEAQVPHFSYVGDSVIGYKSHLGASAITSNLKSDKSDVVLHLEDGDFETGLRKFGAMLGDEAEVGCGSILNPGTIVGKGATIYPLSSVRGCVNKSSIYKSSDNIVAKSKKKAAKE
jgi:hypothetical protein